MKPSTARTLRALFYFYLAFTFFHIAYVVFREPFAFDAWNVAVDSDAKPVTVGRFFEFWHKMYTTSNPRIGQPMAYLAYKTVGFAEIGTPLAYFGIVFGGFVVALRRFPRFSDGRDLATLAIGTGFLWFCAPNFPAYMFCRAYATNYVWMAAVQLWFLVPIRLIGTPHSPQWGPIGLAAYFVLGVVTGMGNEHVGPTLLLFVLLYGGWLWRKRGERPLLLWVGAAGVALGYALVFFAPGQSQRYEGLAERYSPLQQILVRGVETNLDIFLSLLSAAAPIMVFVISAVALGAFVERRTENEVIEKQRDALAFMFVALAAGCLITMTVFASPKLGPRFYMHSMFVVTAAAMGVFRAFLSRPKSFAPFVAFALIASTYAALRTIPRFTRLDRDSKTRLAELAASPESSAYTATAWEQVAENWWFLGDDVRDTKKQEMVAKYFGLRRVLFRGSDQWKTLGVSDVKLTMHYEFEREQCVDELDHLDLKQFIGKSIDALHHQFLDAIVEIERVSGLQLRSIDLTATFLGTQPSLPAPTIYVARWANDKLEGYTADVVRKGRSKTREIVLGKELAGKDFDVYMILIGQPPRKLGSSSEGKPFPYVPWGPGQYWVLACRPDHCFVLKSIAHRI